MNKKIISLLMVICMLITVLAGCGSKAAPTSKNETKDKSADEKITITDMIGREVTLNKKAKKVVAIGAGTLRLYCYVGGPDKIVGIEQFDKDSIKGKPYMMANQSLVKLPVVGQGGPGGSSTPDVEKILAVKPDVIFTTHENQKAAADNLQSKTKIPVVVLDYGKEATFDPAVYKSIELIGKVIGEDKRAKEVVQYMEKCKKDLNDRTKGILESKKPKVYAGALAYMGSHGIESTQGNYALFKALNAKNVADETGKTGSVMVDKEKLIEWNPDKIFLDLNGIKLVKDDYKKNSQFYKGLSAFKKGEVYALLPYNWYWTNIEIAMADAYFIGKIVYPDKFKDIEPEKKADEIYKTLLSKELSAELMKEYSGFKKITLEQLEN